jgi:hypothetical protein
MIAHVKIIPKRVSLPHLENIPKSSLRLNTISSRLFSFLMRKTQVACSKFEQAVLWKSGKREV